MTDYCSFFLSFFPSFFLSFFLSFFPFFIALASEIDMLGTKQEAQYIYRPISLLPLLPSVETRPAATLRGGVPSLLLLLELVFSRHTKSIAAAAAPFSGSWLFDLERTTGVKLKSGIGIDISNLELNIK
jgi:hypothetical protein